MPDREFKINITGDASDLAAAAKQGAGALNETGAAAQQESKSLEESAKKTEFLTLKKGELKKIVRELGHEFPLAGMAAKAMLNPIVFAFTSAISVFVLAKQKLEDWNKEMDAIGQSNAQAKFLAGVEAQKEAMASGAASANEFAQSLQNIASAYDAIETSAQKAMDKIHEFTQGQSGINTAAENRDLALVDLNVKSGKLTEPQGIVARANIKERYARMGDDLKTRQEQEELKVQKSELDASKKAAPELADNEASARSLRDDLATKLAKSKADLSEGKKGLAESQTLLDKRSDELNKAQNAYDALVKLGGDDKFSQAGIGRSRSRLDEAQAKTDEARKARDLQQSENRKNEAFIRDAEVNGMPYANAHLSNAEGALRTNTERIRRLSESIPEETEQYGSRQRARSITGVLRDQATRIDAGSQIQGQQRELEQKMQQLIQEGKGVTPAMTGTLDQLISLFQQQKQAMDDYDKRIRSLEGTRKSNRFGL